MRGAWYLWRGTARGTGRAILVVALIAGLLGAVALAALAGARRTDTAYGRYLTATNASDALVNIPGALPGMPLLQPIQQISHLPGVSSSASYIGLNAFPVVRGKLLPSFLTNGVDGSFNGLYFRQDKMTVLAGRLPPLSATRQLVITPGLARQLRVGVGGTLTYRFKSAGAIPAAPLTRSFRVAAIVLVPPVLVDQADETDGVVLPPGATRQLLAYYQYAWVDVRLAGGPAGVPTLQHQLTTLAAGLQPKIDAATHGHGGVLSFPIGRTDLVHGQVQQSIRPQVVALSAFGAIAALAMIVLVSQGLMQLLSRSAAGVQAMRAVGATRRQAALATALPGIIAVAAGMVLAVAGAAALSPLAPVGPVRRFDPVRGMQLDGLVLGAGPALLALVLLGLLALMAWRAIRPPRSAASRRPSAVAQLAAAAGLPPCAVVGSRNALETEPEARTVPAWVTVIGSTAAVTAVVITAVFGTSLTRLISHPAAYGWNWNVLIQSQGGYGTFFPHRINRLMANEHAVAGWSTFGFSQLPVGGREIPVLGLARRSGFVEPPTTSGRPLEVSGEIELGVTTMHQLGKSVGGTIDVGIARHQRRFTIVGTVTLPSIGVLGTEHVSLGQGAMLLDSDLLAAQGFEAGKLPQPGTGAATSIDSTVAIDLRPGTTEQQRTQLIDRITSANPDRTRGGSYALAPLRAAAVANTSGMGGQPLALALSLATAAVLSLSLTVLASVRRRRRELALLKTLGMTRHQLRSIVAWQTTVTLALTALISIPLGIALGRWAWSAFAGSLGVVPATAIPVLALGAGLAALLTAGNVLSLLPATMAARTPAAATLRAD